MELFVELTGAVTIIADEYPQRSMEESEATAVPVL
jgi:hypothetical protein